MTDDLKERIDQAERIRAKVVQLEHERLQKMQDKIDRLHRQQGFLQETLDRVSDNVEELDVELSSTNMGHDASARLHRQIDQIRQAIERAREYDGKE